MILTDYYKGNKLTNAQSRFDVTASSCSYDFFESLLINKQKFNVGGLSLNLCQRPDRWNGSKTDYAITKGSSNITSVKRPDIESKYSFGDINGTNDGCIIIFNDDFKANGVSEIEVVIARGCKNDTVPLWNLLIDGDLDQELELLRKSAVTKNVTN
jgi:hypothetical protein